MFGRARIKFYWELLNFHIIPYTHLVLLSIYLLLTYIIGMGRQITTILDLDMLKFRIFYEYILFLRFTYISRIKWCIITCNLSTLLSDIRILNHIVSNIFLEEVWIEDGVIDRLFKFIISIINMIVWLNPKERYRWFYIPFTYRRIVLCH